MKKSTLCSILLVILMLFVGCTDSNNTESLNHYSNLVIVAGIRNNCPVIDYNMISPYLEEFCTYGGDITLIDTSANPCVYTNDGIGERELIYSPEREREITQSYINQYIQYFNTLSNTNDESDWLKALTLGARCKENNTLFIVIDSGLSTEGLLKYQNGLLYSDETPAEIAERLSEYLPDLTGADLVWYGLGDTAGEQSELPPELLNRHKSIVEEIIKKTGVDYTFCSDLPTNSSYNLPGTVTCIPIINMEEDTNSNPAIFETVVLDESVIGFKPDTAEFLSYDDAMIALEPISQQLKANPEVCVYIIGTTASAQKEHCITLSQMRAEAVVEVLESKGVSSSQLIPKGMGCENHWHVQDLKDGKQIEPEAQMNRTVRIIDTRSEEAQYAR